MTQIKEGDWVEILVPMPVSLNHRGPHKWASAGAIGQIHSIVHDSAIIDITDITDVGSPCGQTAWRSLFDVRKLTPIEVLAHQAI